MLSDKEEFIQQLITREKKARINWVLTVTGSSIEELESIVEKLGFIIKGPFIALPSEAERIREIHKWEPKEIIPFSKHSSLSSTSKSSSSSKTLKGTSPVDSVLKYSFCTNCGVYLKNTGKAYELTGFCANCGVDLNKVFTQDKYSKEAYKKLQCIACFTINPQKVNYCYHCGSDKLQTLF